MMALCLAVASGSCGQTIVPVRDAKKACEIQIVGLSLVASDVINPAEQGEPRPVVVRIYQLKDELRFQNASFDQIWQNDKEALGDDIVSRAELPAYPNTRTEVKFVRNPEAEYVVAAALFRAHQGKSWFLSFELPPAPGKGDCRTKACEDDSCEGPNLAPQFALWLDRTRVEEGSGHLEDITDDRRVRVVNLGKTASAGAPAPAPATSNP